MMSCPCGSMWLPWLEGGSEECNKQTEEFESDQCQCLMLLKFLVSINVGMIVC